MSSRANTARLRAVVAHEHPFTARLAHRLQAPRSRSRKHTPFTAQAPLHAHAQYAPCTCPFRPPSLRVRRLGCRVRSHSRVHSHTLHHPCSILCLFTLLSFLFLPQPPPPTPHTVGSCIDTTSCPRHMIPLLTGSRPIDPACPARPQGGASVAVTRNGAISPYLTPPPRARSAHRAMDVSSGDVAVRSVHTDISQQHHLSGFHLYTFLNVWPPASFIELFNHSHCPSLLHIHACTMRSRGVPFPHRHAVSYPSSLLAFPQPSICFLTPRLCVLRK